MNLRGIKCAHFGHSFGIDYHQAGLLLPQVFIKCNYFLNQHVVTTIFVKFCS